MRYLFLLYLLLIPAKATALEFSEIAYDVAGSDDGHEWLELHNETSLPIDLAGFYFTDSSNHQLALPPERGSQGSTIVPPNGYVIIADDSLQFLADHPGYSGAVLDTTMSLSNYSTGHTEPVSVKIIDTNKHLVSEAAYLPTPKGEKGYTLELDPDLRWTDSAIVGGSPGAIRPPPAPVLPLPRIRFSEIVSNPEGSDADAELVELYSEEVHSLSLSGWYVTDKPTASGATNRQSLDGQVINGRSFLVVKLKGSFLNNSDETISLYAVDDRRVDSAVLSGKSAEGQSYSLIDETWQWTTAVTLGAPNQPSKVLSEKQTSVSSPSTRGSTSVNPIPSSPVAATKRDQLAPVSATPDRNPAVSAGESDSPRALPTKLAEVAGISTTEPPSLVVGYLVTLGPPALFIAGVLFYLYKRKLLLFKRSETDDDTTVVGS